MSKTRNLSDLLDANGDVKSTALDNVPPSNDASALTTGTLPDARLSTNVTQNSSTQTLTNKTINASSNTLSNIPNSALTNSSITINGSATSLGGSTTINTDLVNDTTPQLGGDLASNGNDILLADNDKIKLGTGNDLEIYHDGSNSIIKDAGTGQLQLHADNFKVMNSSGTENIFFGAEDGTARLFYDNVTKFETTSAGGTLTGTLTATAFSGDGSALTNVPAGVSNVDMQIFGSSGTYTPTSGTKFFTVYATGGGGGAGHIQCTGNSRNISGGGGGAGGTAVRTYNATEMGANASITIGSGGSGSSSSGGSGGSGGTTTFNPAGTGTTIYGYGGTGALGFQGQSNVTSTGTGQGGDGGSGDVNIKGEDGTLGSIANKHGASGYESQQSGSGGNSLFGKGGARKIRFSTSGNAQGSDNGANGQYGGGGSGAVIKSANNNNVGGSGVVIIMEYA